MEALCNLHSGAALEPLRLFAVFATHCLLTLTRANLLAESTTIGRVNLSANTSMHSSTMFAG